VGGVHCRGVRSFQCGHAPARLVCAGRESSEYSVIGYGRCRKVEMKRHASVRKTYLNHEILKEKRSEKGLKGFVVLNPSGGCVSSFGEVDSGDSQSRPNLHWSECRSTVVLRLLGRLQAAYHLEDRTLSEQSGAMGHSYPSHARQRTNRKTLLVNRRLRVRLMLVTL